MSSAAPAAQERCRGLPWLGEVSVSGRRRELQALKCRVILKQMQTPEFGGVEIRDGWLEEEGGGAARGSRGQELP